MRCAGIKIPISSALKVNLESLNTMKKLIAMFALCAASAAFANEVDEFACEAVAGQLHAPTVLKYKGAGYLVAWYEGDHEGAMDTRIVGNRRIGGKWEKPRVLARVGEDAHWNPVLRRGDDGRIILYFKVGHPIPAWKCYFSESRDEGVTWSEPKELVPGDASGGRGPVKNKMLKLASGRWLAGGATERRPWRPFIDLTDDDGRTWLKREIPFPSGSDVYAIQPALWEGRGGTVHALLRTNAGKLWSTASADQGMTWREAKPTDIPHNNSGVDLVKVADGRVFLALNPVSRDWGGRNPLVVWVSEDDGETWKYYRTICWTDGVEDQWTGGEARHRDFSYPALIESEPGVITLVHTYDRRRIRFVQFSITAVRDLAVPLPEHPRPDWERAEWINLNGKWDFKFDGEKEFTKKILVPFGWGCPLSGVKNESDRAQYRRGVKIPEAWKGKRVFLVIGACDHDTTVTFDGAEVGRHEGGYTPFECELTGKVKWGKEQTIGCDVWDEGAESAQKSWRLYGKQGYGNARGIWQTVYLEARGEEYFETVHFTPSIAKKSVTADVVLGAPASGQLICKFAVDGKTHALAFSAGEKRKSLEMPIASPRLWSLDDPYLYGVACEVGGDRVQSYFGFREIGVGKHPQNGAPYVTLNGKPVYLQLTLDQSYHPEGWYTFPTDDFMKNEIMISKKLALSGNRVHIKVEVPRKLYWADKLGLLIQADVPCAWGAVDPRMFRAVKKTFDGMVKRDFNHPSIYQWTLFNETWGLHDKKGPWDPEYRNRYKEPAQREVAKLYAYAKAADPSRLVEDNSACNRDHVVSDVNSWHAYLPWYKWEDAIIEYCTNTYVGSSHNYIGGNIQTGAPMMNSECGNVWGYTGSTGDCDWSWDYHFMMDAFRRHMDCAGWLYTEHHDVINEWNGYVRFDRSPKFTGFGNLFPGMELKDLHADAYLTLADVPCLKCAAGESVKIPIGISLATDRYAGKKPILSYRLRYLDGEGKRRMTEEKTVPYDGTLLSWQCGPLAETTVRMPSRAACGTVNFRLTDGDKVIARNFTCFVTDALAPEHSVSVKACNYSKAEWSAKTWESVFGEKACGAGTGAFEYVFDVANMPKGAKAVFRAEVSTKRLNAKDRDEKDKGAVDLDYMLGGGFADRSKNPNSYPQTSVDKWWGAVKVYANGVPLRTLPIEDDPADSSGILSWFAQKRDGKLNEAGSYGYLVEAAIPAEALAKRADGKVVIRLEAPAKGLAVYGRWAGRYPMDPSVFFIGDGVDTKPFDPNAG